VVLELGGNARRDRLRRCEYRFRRGALRGWRIYVCRGKLAFRFKRILVEDGVLRQVVAALVPRVQKLKVGDVLDEATDVGPLINEAAARRNIE